MTIKLRAGCVSLLLCAAFSVPVAAQTMTEATVAEGLTIQVPADWVKLSEEELAVLNERHDEMGGPASVTYNFAFSTDGYVDSVLRLPYVLGQVFRVAEDVTVGALASRMGASDIPPLIDRLEDEASRMSVIVESQLVGRPLFDSRANLIWAMSRTRRTDGSVAEGLSCWFKRHGYMVAIHFYESPPLRSERWSLLERIASER